MATRILVSAVEGADVLGVSERLYHEFRHRPDFPSAVRLSARCVRWRLDELETWAQSLPRHVAWPEPEQLREKRRGRETQEGGAPSGSPAHRPRTKS